MDFDARARKVRDTVPKLIHKLGKDFPEVHESLVAAGCKGIPNRGGESCPIARYIRQNMPDDVRLLGVGSLGLSYALVTIETDDGMPYDIKFPYSDAIASFIVGFDGYDFKDLIERRSHQ